MWPSLIIAVLVVALVALQLRWQRRFARSQTDFRRNLDASREQQQQSTRQVESQQDALFNSMVEGVLVLDRDGRILLSNDTFNRLFALPGDVRGRTLMEALRLHEVAELVGRLGREQSVLNHELRIAGVEERWLNVSASTINPRDGVSEGSILVFHDLTRLKQLERTREEFVANVSHELRTPLSMIKGYVETLLDGAKDDPATADKFLRVIEKHVDRLTFLIEDLLTISKLESGRILINSQPLALGTLVDKVFEDLKARTRERGIQLKNEVTGLEVAADADRLEQVFANLLDNAIKYGRGGGSVTVRARVADEREIEVCVEDDGPGFPPEAIERVFERFYRIDKARSREQGGTGLGLAIVKHIVQSHGGRVWAESGQGSGAKFFFTLPKA